MNVNIEVAPVMQNGCSMHQIDVIADGYQPVYKIASFVVPCSFENAYKCGEEIRAAFFKAQLEKKPFSVVPSNGLLDAACDDSAEVINKAAYVAGYRVQENLLNDLTAKYCAVETLAKSLNNEKINAEKLAKKYKNYMIIFAMIGTANFFIGWLAQFRF